jgi:intracellular sulfur oxidation DsrE/DsrF family protein
MRLASAVRTTLAALTLATLAGVAGAQTAPTPALRIDVPVVLKEARVVFNMDHLVFEGTVPTGLAWMKRNTESFIRDRTSYQVFAIFHGPGGFMLLNDASYDRVRKTTGGNPHRTLIAELQRLGIRFEECGETARLNGWTNADLLPGVQVTTSAILRLIQLGQDGFVQIQP